MDKNKEVACAGCNDNIDQSWVYGDTGLCAECADLGLNSEMFLSLLRDGHVDDDIISRIEKYGFYIENYEVNEELYNSEEPEGQEVLTFHASSSDRHKMLNIFERYIVPGEWLYVWEHMYGNTNFIVQKLIDTEMFFKSIDCGGYTNLGMYCMGFDNIGLIDTFMPFIEEDSVLLLMRRKEQFKRVWDQIPFKLSYDNSIIEYVSRYTKKGDEIREVLKEKITGPGYLLEWAKKFPCDKDYMKEKFINGALSSRYACEWAISFNEDLGDMLPLINSEYNFAKLVKHFPHLHDEYVDRITKESNAFDWALLVGDREKMFNMIESYEYLKKWASMIENNIEITKRMMLAYESEQRIKLDQYKTTHCR